MDPSKSVCDNARTQCLGSLEDQVPRSVDPSKALASGKIWSRFQDFLWEFHVTMLLSIIK